MHLLIGCLILKIMEKAILWLSRGMTPEMSLASLPHHYHLNEPAGICVLDYKSSSCEFSKSTPVDFWRHQGKQTCHHRHSTSPGNEARASSLSNRDRNPSRPPVRVRAPSFSPHLPDHADPSRRHSSAVYEERQWWCLTEFFPSTSG